MKKNKPKYYANGGQIPTNSAWNNSALAGSVSGAMGSLLSLMDKPTMASSQPLVNPMTMRAMFSPYAFGGTIQDLSEEELMQVQQLAQENNVSVEDAFNYINSRMYDNQTATMPQTYETEEPDEFAGMEQDEMGSVPQFAKGGWIKKAAASIKRRGTKGKCTPITKPGCTGRAKALAKTFKKIARNRKKKGHAMGGIMQYQNGGPIKPTYSATNYPGFGESARPAYDSGWFPTEVSTTGGGIYRNNYIAANQLTHGNKPYTLQMSTGGNGLFNLYAVGDDGKIPTSKDRYMLYNVPYSTVDTYFKKLVEARDKEVKQGTYAYGGPTKPVSDATHRGANTVAPPIVNGKVVAPSGEAFDEQDFMLSIFKALDPTGITNYSDLYDAWKSGDKNARFMETFASLPMVGKVGKGIKAIEGAVRSYRTDVPVLKGLRYTTSGASTMKDFNDKKAYGGSMNTIAEVEGGEVIQAPGSKARRVYGRKHEDGGVVINAPVGTKVFSDRLEIDGKSMAKRKEARDKLVANMERRFNADPTNKILRSTIERQHEVLSMEEEQDMALQEFANEMYATPEVEMPTAAYGDSGLGEEDEWLNQSLYGNYIPNAVSDDFRLGLNIPSGNTLETYYARQANRKRLPAEIDTSMFGDGIESYGSTTITKAPPNAGGVTVTPRTYTPPDDTPPPYKLGIGDYLGMTGNVLGPTLGLFNTEAMRKASKPRINRYVGVGQRAIDNWRNAQDYAYTDFAEDVRDIDTRYNTLDYQQRTGASSVNTLRGLQSAVTQMRTDAKLKARGLYGNRMTELLGREAQATMEQDLREATGQTAVDEGNIADMDAYFNARGDNFQDIAAGLQRVGAGFNRARENQTNLNLISQLSKYGLGITADGTVYDKKAIQNRTT